MLGDPGPCTVMSEGDLEAQYADVEAVVAASSQARLTVEGNAGGLF